MSVATVNTIAIDNAIETFDHEVVDADAWIDHSASLRRLFTGDYEPRHRADGPAL